MKKISVVIPCYNEEDVLLMFYNRASDVLWKMECDYTLLFIDDGSKDKTLEILRQLSGMDEHIEYISLTRNFGKEASMYAGLCAADGDYVAIMDADLQDPPEMLPDMFERLETGEYDCIAARRTDRKGEPKIRSFFAERFCRVINRISDIEIYEGERDYRMMTRRMADTVKEMSERNRFSKGLFAWTGFKTLRLEYDNRERAAGSTKWKFSGLLGYALEGIFDFSSFPADLIMYGGMAVTGTAFLTLFVMALLRFITGAFISGTVAVICLMFFLGGLELTAIGIMGQYVIRTYTEVRKRPVYIVKEQSRRKETDKTIHKKSR